ncbi:hypothetical protein RvY_15753 [Ramazzottius varieornatus]|uniref:Uncharacterized protein n=1 Tax=Ramazzottius varieornatus TaxID=947166 RepID=A0A1D1VW16_RAMVA|nr:hypothetical protein RvY_15753 [Ramazzottius varieornatus]
MRPITPRYTSCRLTLQTVQYCTQKRYSHSDDVIFLLVNEDQPSSTCVGPPAACVDELGAGSNSRSEEARTGRFVWSNCGAKMQTQGNSREKHCSSQEDHAALGK